MFPGVSVEVPAGGAAVVPEGGDLAVSPQLLGVEQLAVLRGVARRAGGGRGGGAAGTRAHAAAPVTLARLRPAEVRLGGGTH